MKAYPNVCKAVIALCPGNSLEKTKKVVDAYAAFRRAQKEGNPKAIDWENSWARFGRIINVAFRHRHASRKAVNI